jgi:LPXTG-site transpeptidase (sortase) family protein
MTLRRASSVILLLGAVLLASVGLWHAESGRAADAAQEAMAGEWAQHVADRAASEPVAVPPGPAAGAAGDAAPTLERANGPGRADDPALGTAAGRVAAVGENLGEDGAVALLEVRRPGFGPLLGGPLFVSEGVGPGQLARGPGHFPGSALPGQEGNFAVAGHRTTHGGPFGDLDGLRAGDEIHVTDSAGQRFLYLVLERRIVSPADTWVAGPDPLGHGTPTLTLTTCHPRYSARQRLVVWAELA